MLHFHFLFIDSTFSKWKSVRSLLECRKNMSKHNKEHVQLRHNTTTSIRCRSVLLDLQSHRWTYGNVNVAARIQFGCSFRHQIVVGMVFDVDISIGIINCLHRQHNRNDIVLYVLLSLHHCNLPSFRIIDDVNQTKCPTKSIRK